MGNYVKHGHRHGLACQTLYTDTLPYVKKFRIGTTVTANMSHSVRVRQISVLRHGFMCKNLHTEKVLQVKSFGCTSFRVGQRWNTRCDMLIVTHRHIFISQQVNDLRRSCRSRHCGRPAMQQSAGADERNSSDSLEDRNAGAQLNDSFQFNRATMVTSEHKSTTEGATSDKLRYLGI